MSTLTDTTLTMKALTLWQPWASLVADGRKEIDTRSWAPPQTLRPGSLFAIHAGGTVIKPEFARKFGYLPLRLPRGAALCIVRFVESFRFTAKNVADISAEELTYGDFTPGRWGWRLELVHNFDPPISAKGSRRLWSWTIPDSHANEVWGLLNQ